MPAVLAGGGFLGSMLYFRLTLHGLYRYGELCIALSVYVSDIPALSHAAVHGDTSG